MTDDLFSFAARAAEAERLRDRGMALASDAQDVAVPDWSELAYRAIVAVARDAESVHVDNVLAVFDIEPHHHNAWGAPWMRAIKDGVIERTGMVRASADPRKHKHNYPVYRSLVFAGSRRSVTSVRELAT